VLFGCASARRAQAENELGVPTACSVTPSATEPQLRAWDDASVWKGVAALDGQVVDVAGRPLYSASVELRADQGGPSEDVRRPLGTMTDTLGRFRLTDLSPGWYLLTVRRIGSLRQQHQIVLVGGTTYTVCVWLRRNPIQLSPVTTGDS